MKKLILALVATFAATGAAHAQSTAQVPGPYVGAAVSNVGKMMSDGRKAQAKIFAGYEFDQNFGVEAGVTNRSSESLDVQLNGQAYTARTRGYNSYVAGKYTMPINEQFSAYGKLGMSYQVVKHSGAGFSHKDDDTGLYAGLGLQYKVTDKVALTAEYERSGKREGVNDPNDAWTLGMKVGF